jgi:hypothetical protein
MWLASLTDSARENLWAEFPDVTSHERLRKNARDKFGAEYGLPSTHMCVDTSNPPSAPEPPIIAAPAVKIDEPSPEKPQIEIESKPPAGKMTGHQCYGGMFA